MEVVNFCSTLIKCKSVAPQDDGAIDLIADYLTRFKFDIDVLTFISSDGSNSVKNLFAKYGKSRKKILGFLGHSDVVPSGDGWDDNPFGGILKDGFIIGRGATDMKGGIAAFCGAVSKFLSNTNGNFDGTIEILITGDEEIGSYEGARSLIEWCKKTNNIPHDCLIGEPTSRKKIGDNIYLGHRGSMNISVKSIGKQGHVAYPNNYKNSLTDVCSYIAKMVNYPWKHNDKRFPQTNLEPTMLFTGNYANNIVPEISSANLNIRYASDYSAEDLIQICKKESEGLNVLLEFSNNGDAYFCDAEYIKNLLSKAILETTGLYPEFSAAGGTSDGRFMRSYCNIIEFGLLDQNMHQKNEKIKIEDLITLEKIYLSFIEKYFL